MAKGQRPDQPKVKHRFTTIEVYEETTHRVYFDNAWIIIREKIDGANVQIENTDGSLRCGSREYELSEDFHLSKAYPYVQQLEPESFEEGKLYFGEWITPYRLNYKNDNQTIRLFAVVEAEKQTEHSTFLSRSKTRELIEKTGLKEAPILYEGPFVSMEHIQSFIGQTSMVQALGWKEDYVPAGEGVVVYVYESDNETLKTIHNKPLIVKMVVEDFKERKLVPKQAVSDHNTALMLFLTEVTTEARIKKRYLDQKDLGTYPDVLTKKDLGTVMKTLPSIVWEDILKEHREEYEALLHEYIEKEKIFLVENVSAEKAESVEKEIEKSVSKKITNEVLKFVQKQF